MHVTVAVTPDGAAAFWLLGELSGASCALAGRRDTGKKKEERRRRESSTSRRCRVACCKVQNDPQAHSRVDSTAGATHAETDDARITR